MLETTPEYPELDFATDAIPDLHGVLADLRERHAVAPVRYHGGVAYLISRYEDLKAAFSNIEGERLTNKEIFSFLRLLFPAGADTTYRGLGSLFYTVIDDRAVWEAVGKDPDLIPAVVQEALRWESPTAVLPRFAPKKTSLARCDIPEGAEVLFGITAADRDPRIFKDGDRFNPWRSERESLSFGLGLHFCLGSHLARREMEVSLRVLSERLPDLRLAQGAKTRIEGTVLRGPTELSVEFTPSASP